MSLPPPAPDPQRPLHPLLPWLVWGLGAFLFAFTHFQRVAPGVMVDTLMREFAVGGALLGNLSAIYFYTYSLFQIPAGLVVDAYGSRRILVISALTIALGSFVFSQAHGLAGAIMGRLLIGVGGAATFVVAYNLAALWFPPRRFALLSGLTVAAGVSGAVIGQVPLAWAVETIGWRPALAGASLLALAAGIAALPALRLRRPAMPEPRRAAPAAARRGMAASFRDVLRQPDLWTLTFAGGGNMVVMLTFGGLWAVPWLVQVHGLTRGEAAVAVSLTAIGWVAGSPLMGWLGQRLGGRRGLFLAANLASMACFAALLFLPGHSMASLHALLFLQGIATGAVVLVFTTTHERFAGGQESVSLGIVNTAIMLGTALFQTLVGWVLDLNWLGVMAQGARVYDADAYRTGLSLLFCGGLLALTAGSRMPRTDGA